MKAVNPGPIPPSWTLVWSDLDVEHELVLAARVNFQRGVLEISAREILEEGEAVVVERIDVAKPIGLIATHAAGCRVLERCSVDFAIETTRGGTVGKGIDQISTTLGGVRCAASESKTQHEHPTQVRQHLPWVPGRLLGTNSRTTLDEGI